MQQALVGDIGTNIKITVMNDGAVFNISSATDLQMVFKKPTSTTCTTVDATLFTDGTDGIMVYTTPDEDFLDVDGIWDVQGVVTLPTGTWHTKPSKFRVRPNLCSG